VKDYKEVAQGKYAKKNIRINGAHGKCGTQYKVPLFRTQITQTLGPRGSTHHIIRGGLHRVTGRISGDLVKRKVEPRVLRRIL